MSEPFTTKIHKRFGENHWLAELGDLAAGEGFLPAGESFLLVFTEVETT
jgi:hypothetical protein